jgi:hypothetical protein
MPAERIPALSISALKSILLTNHVNAGMVLEKGDLVLKVQHLVDEERMNRERQRAVEEAEELEQLERERERELLEEDENQRQQRQQRESHNDHTTNDRTAFEPEKPTSGDPPTPQQKPAAKPAAPSSLDRDGLCVVCYDNEANIAIVDCGYVFSDDSLCISSNLILICPAISRCVGAVQSSSWKAPASAPSAVPV